MNAWITAASVTAAAGTVLTARLWPAPAKRGRHRASSSAGFYRRAPWAWCPAEQAEMPHQFDAGARRCLSCKTTTTTKRDGHDGTG